ncbi:MAG: T9SS type A sorting domain-containing protein, partial [Chlorobi bacterium]|nr:T9SS type A sorting domain-containing protein [Chlorobiota bacterium]
TIAISARNKDYNTVQFYSGDIISVINTAADDLVGGTQDNGTPTILDAVAGANSSTDITGGDGGYTEYDDAGVYIVTAYPNNNHYAFVFGTPNTFYQISSGTGGSFINEAALDKNLDILYSNSSTSTPTYSIERTSNFVAGAGGIVNTSIASAVLNASPTAFKVSPFTPGSTKLFVGLENGRLLRIDNADGAFGILNISAGSGFVGSISDIEFGQNEMEIFVTMHNYGVTSIWFTSDGGSNWSSKEGDLPDLPVKCILQNPLIPNEVIIGTELGVWATADYTQASPVWVQSYNGMSDVTVLDLDVRTSDNMVLASTHGRGFFTSQFTAVPLGVSDNSLVSKGIRIFPTINNGNFTIVAKNSLGNVNMRIYNITGQEVLNSKFQLSNAQNRFNLNVNSGIYFVNLKGDDFGGTQKIIIK